MASYIEEPIAVVGMSCRFPGGASSPSKLWDLLKEPRDVLGEFDGPETLNLKRFYHRDGDVHGSTDVQNKAYLLQEDTRLFDAAFFGISPFEASGMDPQQRLLLEVVYEAFESAGATLDQLKGSLTSVHVGVMTADYANIQLRDLETVAKYVATGTANSILSNRISYIFDLKGPSETIDTACSSSLVALHNAARGLLARDCDTAVVAGVNLIFDAASFINESKLHMLSPDGRSRMWNKDANGYARGEGVAALFLKPLSKALRDGDYIEGVIRASGVNSDGQSSGITMPFAPTQAELIRHTYRRAGLDPVRDRPQYFECHGTGTPAGDPVEARAISESLLTNDKGDVVATPDDPLYVGSIKTIIGHLEGCAGLAGVIKVLLSLKNRTIPPNLLFDESNINSAVARYYGPMKIITECRPWPTLPTGVPARASVNSFGFGGTNAHAIIESFDNGSVRKMGPDSPGHTAQTEIIGPLVFSASSGSSLLSTIRNHLQHLRTNPSLNLSDLAWTLQTRRSTHAVRAHFSGTSRASILESMSTWVTSHENLPSSAAIGYQPHLVNPSEVPGILGVFTGQGAQWPTMGSALIHSSPLFRQTIQACEATLQALPPSDIPNWSLITELTAPPSSSRISSAAISQPLCTAVQIALVNLLTSSGIKFSAVVGHSSGEIAATYAAGIITLQAAMQIAYYRGLHSSLASGPNATAGGMLAAGLTHEKALEFLIRPEFHPHIQLAAHNAPQSVTLSGDLSTILSAKTQLDSHNIFARLLKVDTAYHSHHMTPCSNPYLTSLQSCNIEITPPTPTSPIWTSSVRGDTELLRGGDLSSLKAQYWVDNMAQPVLFSKAIESTIWHGGPWDLAIEVGPHPALKGPVEQTIRRVFDPPPVYSGTLARGTDDVSAFSAMIGMVWAHLGDGFVDFEGYRGVWGEEEVGAFRAVRAVRDLPGYTWDHDKVYWRESRISKRYRTGEDEGHELLGRRAPDDNEREMRWRNVVKLSEMPWIRGHHVLDEVLLPAAAYVSMAVEAGNRLAVAVGRGRPVRLLEVLDVEILRPLVVPDDKEGVETVFTIGVLDDHLNGGDVLRARFSYYVAKESTVGDMMHTCSGILVVHLGEEGERSEGLPGRGTAPPNIANVDADQIYAMFGEVGLAYSGPFCAIQDSRRCLGYAAARGDWPEGSLSDHYVVHPAMLDVAFQTAFIARAHPATRLMTSAYLPSRIGRVLVDPSIGLVQDGSESSADFEAWVVEQAATSFSGDLNVYQATIGRTLLQVEGLVLRIIGEPDASHDRNLFAKTVWDRDVSAGVVDPVRDMARDAVAHHKTEVTERFALYYIKRVVEAMSKEERSQFQWHHQNMLEAFEGRIAAVRSGQNPVLPRIWLDDDQSVVDGIYDVYPDWVDLQLIRAVGENMPDVVRGETQLLEVMNKDDMLHRMYGNDTTFLINDSIAEVLRQITFKFPRCNILEVGAGTGATTWTVLNTIGDAYDSYTYTDISPGFFESAANKFAPFTDKMIFKVLDAEKEPSEQGLANHSYDIIIAANVLHATRSLHTTLQNVRSLLKPGGYLVLMETTGPHTISHHLIYGGLEGWWRNERPDPQLGPVTTAPRWDTLLRETGFSGVDTAMHDLADVDRHKTSLIVSQAVSDMTLRLQDPFSAIHEARPLDSAEPLLIVGGKRLWTSQTMGEIQKLLPRLWRGHVQTAGSIDELDQSWLTPGVNIICLQDIDEPLFAGTMTSSRMAALQNLLISTKVLLWVTPAGRAAPRLQSSFDPRAAMFHAIARTASVELPHLRVQALGLEVGSTAAPKAARYCVEAFLRLREAEDKDDKAQPALWLHEPEVEILADGQVLIPREVPDRALNERYIASKRTLTHTVDAAGGDLAIRAVLGASNKIQLQHVQSTENPDSTMGSESIRIDVSFALYIPEDHVTNLYLVAGYMHFQDTQSTPIMAISSVNASVIHVNPDDVVPMEGSGDCSPETLMATANWMFARSICAMAAKLPSHCSVILYGAHKSFARLVSTELARLQITACFMSSDTDVSTKWVRIHPSDSKRAVAREIPHGAQLYIDCSEFSSQAAGNQVDQTLRDCLPSGCVTGRLNADLLHQAIHTSSTEISLRSLLKTSTLDSRKAVKAGKDIGPCDCPMVKASDLAGAPVSSLMQTRFVTDWRKRDSLPLTILPLHTHGLFRPDRTYLMAGCAGGLGMSICQWMIRQGARHLVVTSRRPRIDPAMINDALRLHGASIHALSMDVTNKDSVKDTIARVRDDPTMPSIAGVCNAAMVLNDRFFVDMDIQELNDTLAPKVLGTEHLDAEFSDTQTQLEFFVLLSSSTCIIGNFGQANYSAANMFMASLAARRRARSLAGSVIHIGHVADVGYVTDQGRGRGLAEHFRNIRLTPLSETEVHQAFAEAVGGGKPGSSTGSPEITVGLEPATEPMVPGMSVPWLSSPRLSHFLPFSSLKSKEGTSRGAGSAGGARQLVEDAETEEQAVAVVLGAFCERLEVILQLPAGSAGQNARKSVIDLGIDSLVAVELRTWFIKELGADVPVVKILGGDTILQLCTLAAKKMLAKNMAKKSDESLESKKVVVNDVGKSVSQTATRSSSSTRDTGSTPISSPASTKGDDTEISSEQSTVVSGGLPQSVKEQIMSPSQSRIWFMSKHFLDTPAAYTTYNMVFHYRLHGSFSIARLRHALQTTIQHHDCLMMRFYARPDGVPMQAVMAMPNYELKHIPDANPTNIQAEVATFKSKTWDLENGNTFGATVLSSPSADSHDLIFGYHHIIMDGIAWHLFTRDLDLAYRMRLLDKTTSTSHLDYTSAQLALSTTPAFTNQLTYWANEFKTLPEPLPLLPAFALVKTRPPNPFTLGSHHASHELTPSQMTLIKSTSHRLKIPPFHLHLSVLALLLARHTSTTALTLGIVDANRLSPLHSQIVACLMNILPVRFSIPPPSTNPTTKSSSSPPSQVNVNTFPSLARTTSKKALAAFANAGVPLETILDHLQLPRSTTTTPLFQVLANYRTVSIGERPLGDNAVMKLVTGKDAKDPYEISWGFVDLGEDTGLVQMTVLAALYSEEGCRGLLGEYVRVLEWVLRGEGEGELDGFRIVGREMEGEVEEEEVFKGEIMDLEVKLGGL